MNAKKFLKQQAEQDKQDILAESGEKSLEALREKIQPNEKKRARLKKWLPAAASAVAAAAVLVTCIAVFHPWDKTPNDSVQAPSEPDDTRYGNEGELAFSNLEEVNSALKEFCFIGDDPDYTYTVMRAYDLESGETQYYSLSYASMETPIEIEFVALGNDDYGFWNESLSATTAELPGYTVTYYTWEKYLAQYDETVLCAHAKIVKGDETIYVTKYSETTDDPEGSFLEVVGSILH